jgi:TrmH family RNA methyltransferase
MKVKDIASAQNPLLQKIRRLNDSSERKQLGLFLIEGPKLIEEALSKDVEIVDLVASKSFFESGVDRTALKAVDTLTVVHDRVFKGLCTTASSCGILATAKPKHYTLEQVLKKKAGIFVFGECIQDPGNLGTMIRTALAFDAQGMILTSGSVDHLSPKVVRASMGAIFSLPIAAEQELDYCLPKLKASDLRLVALDAKARQTFDSEAHAVQTVYLFGNEGQGLSPKTLKKADRVVSIPINPLAESLNVAVAMGIVLYHSQPGSKGETLHSR